MKSIIKQNRIISEEGDPLSKRKELFNLLIDEAKFYEVSLTQTQTSRSQSNAVVWTDTTPVSKNVQLTMNGLPETNEVVLPLLEVNNLKREYFCY